MNGTTHRLIGLSLCASLLLAGCLGPAQPPGGPSLAPGEGRAVFLITDAAPDLGAIRSVELTTSGVWVHAADRGWVSVSTTPQTYDLLALRDSQTLSVLANATLPEGVYQQVRLDASRVVVTDADGEHEAKLPSGELRFVSPLEVSAGQTTSVLFDFEAAESLHVTGQGEYVFAPVVRLETQNDALVDVKADQRVFVFGSRKRESILGMDENGTMREGAGILRDRDVSIDPATGRIRVSTLPAGPVSLPLVFLNPAAGGPFPSDSPSGLTPGAWLAARGTGTYVVDRGRASLGFEFQNLVPNATYAVWCPRVTAQPNPRVDYRPCGAADGSQNAFRADARGGGRLGFAGLRPLPWSDPRATTAIALVYHRDGRGQGATPGGLGSDSFVQLYALLGPAPPQAG